MQETETKEEGKGRRTRVKGKGVGGISDGSMQERMGYVYVGIAQS